MTELELFLGTCMFMLGLVQLIITLSDRNKK
ncbi:hypothetical protein SAMN06295960_4056 [Paenibacillus aquistagni]|uniref:Holin-like Toxin (Hol-Tox) n=1 Tax=Paenibacillus aquistagni TaxID=1852522 RepID=A0A1X7LPZ1_9BACL|nr:hypothetical protein SAMN06295960_4056 [Paenibacillus aquistagni]